MDLGDRLRRVGMGRPQPSRPDLSRTTEAQPPLESLVDGRWVDRDGLRCFVTEDHYAGDHIHGGLALTDLASVASETWHPHVDNPEAFDIGRALFFDIETTGLGRGAGTYAFMVGVGRFEGQGFVVRQYFMPDYAEEGALLDLLVEDLAEAEGLVSFNGRSFDWPIVESRLVLAGRQPPALGDVHLDLLLLARRLWRHVLDSCALSALEVDVLGLERRSDDVPGYLIPQLYQDYLRRGRTRPLVGVFYHNHIDILSMVSLATRMGRILSSPFERSGDWLHDYCALGTLYERQGYTDGAIKAYRLATQDSVNHDRVATANQRLSLLLKRLGQYQEAIEIWHSLLGGNELYPYVELAKQYEHRIKDLDMAEQVVHQAIEWLRTGDANGGPVAKARTHQELTHRLARVQRKKQRVSSCPKTGNETGG